MKNKLKELDVDSIGTQEKPLTKDEQAAISTFLQKRKEQLDNKISKSKKRLGKKSATARI